jgi:hypothetical protein
MLNNTTTHRLTAARLGIDIGRIFTDLAWVNANSAHPDARSIMQSSASYGGGHGDFRERDLALVARDLRDGFVIHATAHED